MPESSDAVRDQRRAPFCYQTHAALALIRENFQGAKRTTALAVYLGLTEAANAAGGAAARNGFEATRGVIAEAVGISVDTLDRYVADLVKIGLVEVLRQKVGKVNLPNVWALTEAVPASPVAAPVRPGGSRVGAAQEPKKETIEKREPSAPGAGAPVPEVLDPEKPPKIALVEGRNLPLDALAAECGIDEDSPRLGQALVALNGSRGQVGIRHLFWKEAHRWAEQHGRLPQLSDLVSDPEWLPVHLAQAITRKAALYRERMHGAILTPTALRDWWLDLEKQAAAADAGLTPEEIANIS